MQSFYFRYDTDNLALDISWYRFQPRYEWHTFITYFVSIGKAALSDITYRLKLVCKTSIATCCVGVQITVTCLYKAEALVQNGMPFVF